jgi:hypothetical protein
MCARAHYNELVLLYTVQPMGHILHSGVFTVQNINALFFMLRWAQCASHKKHAWACYYWGSIAEVYRTPTRREVKCSTEMESGIESEGKQFTISPPLWVPVRVYL